MLCKNSVFAALRAAGVLWLAALCQPALAGPAEDCRLAAALPESGWTGVPFAAIDPATAMVLCEAAVKADPDDMASLARLARVLGRADRDAEAYALLAPHEAGDSPDALAYLAALVRDGTPGTEPDIARATALFQRAADLGSAFAAMNLYYIHSGDYGPADPERIAPALERAVDLGHPEAQMRRARQLMSSDNPDDTARAIELLLLADAAGQSEAAYLLGFMHDFGNGVPEDDSLALHWYGRETARFDSGPAVTDAWLRSAKILRAGHDNLPADPAAAIAALEKAAAAGEPEAWWVLGEMARLGEGQPADPRKALDLFRTAEAAGDIYSAVELGYAYVEGKATVQDYAEAARWFGKAAANDAWTTGWRDGRVNLALRYYYGFDNERNRDEALRLMAEVVQGDDTGAMKEAGTIMILDDDPAVLRRGFLLLLRAAARGNVGAQLETGWAYANGKGTPLNYASAAVWYERAALAGNRTAARNLAELHEEGYLGTVDMDAALKWYRQAAEAGQSTARRRLADILSRSDSAADRAEALHHLITDAESLNPEAAILLGAVIDDTTHSLHALAASPEHSPAVAQAALTIGAAYEEPVTGCLSIAMGCGMAERRIDMASAAEWFRRAAPLPMADFRLARLLLTHPELAASAEEAGLLLARAADSGLPEAALLQQMTVQGAAMPADAIFSISIKGLTPDRAASLAALAATARFGDAMIGPGWAYLRDASERGDGPATTAFLRVLVFYGAFDRAADTLAALPGGAKVDLAGMDYTLDQMLTLWLGEIRNGFDPDPRLVTALVRLLPELVQRGADGAERLDIMLAEVTYRLAQRDANTVPGDAPDIGKGRSLVERLADIDVTIADYSEGPGLAAQLVPLYRQRARLLAEAGDVDAAREALFQATALATEINDQTRHLSGSLIHHMESACILRKASESLYAWGDAAQGLAFAKAATNALQSARQALTGLPQDMQSCFRDAIADQYRALAGLMIDAGQLNEAQDVLTQLADFEAYRFWQDDASLAGEAFAQVPVAPAEGALVDRVAGLGLADLANLRNRLEAARVAGDAKTIAALETELEAAQEALAQSLDDLGDALDARLDAAPEGPAAEAAEELAADISARSVRRLQGRLQEVPGLAAVYSVTLPERTHFLIVTAAGTEHIALEMPADDLARVVEGFRLALQGKSNDPALDQAQLVHARIWAPIETALQTAGITDVLLSLDSPMRQLPIGAMHDGQRWLLEQRRYVSFTPAGQDLLLDDSPLDLTSVEALGASEGGAGFSALPNVARELRAIVREDEDDWGILPGRIRLNAAFDAEGLGEAVGSGAPVIHVASHFDLRDRDDRSVLLMGNGETLSMAELKSGIRKGRFDLSGVEMLILSACQTALDGSAGLESLASAMHGEGVRTVLATLWPVPDRSTALFMQRYYLHLSSGAGRAEALRLTQMDFLASVGSSLPDMADRGAVPLPDAPQDETTGGLSHPRAWAGFQLTGQWR